MLLTRGMSLQRWQAMGTLDRELAIYRRLAEAGLRVSVVGFGDRADLNFAQQIAPLRIRCNRWTLPARLYAALLPLLHARTFRHCDVIKTNQSDGADLALRCARRWHTPLIARCGFMWSFVETQRRGAAHPKAQRAARIEATVFPAATRVQVTTEAMARDVAGRFPDAAQRVRVVPNYVDTEHFKPIEPPAKITPVDLLFIGRLSGVKNLEALIEAVAKLPLRVRFVGIDAPTDTMRRRLDAGRATLECLGPVAHEQLPAHLAAAKAFILPSLYEGHPKALIEAMACGAAVIATNRPGLAELIDHRRSGYLCEPDAASLREAVRRVLADDALRTAMGTAARAEALARFSLDRIVELEQRVIAEAVDE